MVYLLIITGGSFHYLCPLILIIEMYSIPLSEARENRRSISALFKMEVHCNYIFVPHYNPLKNQLKNIKPARSDGKYFQLLSEEIN